MWETERAREAALGNFPPRNTKRSIDETIKRAEKVSLG
jgi:hypothetical protein